MRVAASESLPAIAAALWENPTELARVAYLHIPHHFRREPALGFESEFLVHAGRLFERTKGEGPEAFAEAMLAYLNENALRFVRA